MKRRPCKSKDAYTAAEIEEITGGDLKGNPQQTVKRVSGVESSSPDSITFAENNKYLKKAEQSSAGIILVPESITESDNTIIRVENPRLSYARVAEIFPDQIYYQSGIHDSAIISDSAILGDEVSIRANVVIADNAKIGNNVTLAPGVYVGANVKIGSDTIIHPQVVIEYDCILGSGVIIHPGTIIGAEGYGYVSDQKQHYKIPQLGKVIIKDKVEIGANVTIDRGTSGSTVIGQGTKIDNLVQIAHNVKIGPESLIIAQAGIAGSCELEKRVTLAGQTGVVGHSKIGEEAVIATNSLVTKDTPEGVFYSGNPAHDHSDDLREQAARRKLPDLLKKIRNLEQKIKKLEGEINQL